MRLQDQTVSKSLAFGKGWYLFSILSIALLISLGINKLLRLAPIWFFKGCVCPQTPALSYYLQGVAQMTIGLQ